jgi:hypothetical protein
MNAPRGLCTRSSRGRLDSIKEVMRVAYAAGMRAVERQPKRMLTADANTTAESLSAFGR